MSKEKSLLSTILQRWFLKRIQPQHGTIRLHRKIIYILPARYGCYFALIALLMLLGAINYGNNMGFILVFLLLGMSGISMLYSYRNLINICITPWKSDPVFAGESASFKLRLTTDQATPAHAISYGLSRHQGETADIPANSDSIIQITVPTIQRGLHKLEPVRLWTEFPLGFFHVWSWIHPDMSVIVYPKPAGKSLALMLTSTAKTGERNAKNHSDDDYAGLRKYQPGDAPRHIAWKAFAKGYALLTKQFSALTSHEIWLDWYTLETTDPEQRLSQLCRWVLEAHRGNLSYGLILPGKILQPAEGEQHRSACLQALALFAN